MNNVEALKNAICAIVSENGNAVFENNFIFEKRLRAYMQDENTISQFMYILKASNIKRYIEKGNLAFVEINNIIISTENATGIKREIVEECILAILEATGFNTDIPKSRVIKSDNKNIISSFTPENYNEILNNIEVAIFKIIKFNEESNLSPEQEQIKKHQMQTITDNADVFERACKQNNARALYLRALCYKFGVASPKMEAPAEEFFIRAEQNGSVNAAKYLGDIEYNYEHYTDAYNHYTQIGAVALDRNSQQNLINILNHRNINKKVFILSIISYILFFVFDILFMKGVFCPIGCTHYPTGIISIILSTITFAILSYFAIKKKYDTPKYSLTIMTMLFCITTFCALAF